MEWQTELSGWPCTEKLSILKQKSFGFIKHKNNLLRTWTKYGYDLASNTTSLCINFSFPSFLAFCLMAVIYKVLTTNRIVGRTGFWFQKTKKTKLFTWKNNFLFLKLETMFLRTWPKKGKSAIVLWLQVLYLYVNILFHFNCSIFCGLNFRNSNRKLTWDHEYWMNLLGWIPYVLTTLNKIYQHDMNVANCLIT